ncbi:hypothetical protein ACH5RR_034805 [Cinchona calisaya]|uniref:Uncharacterized protein n=1 Tax=Cinchona calisaya TaxID=153742 RepID=A0ABD2YFB6_9GENT
MTWRVEVGSGSPSSSSFANDLFGSLESASPPSSCLVKIEDDRKFLREFVVDLVGEPGNVHGADSSINEGVLSPVPSPFQITHLKEYQHPYIDDEVCGHIQSSKNICALYSGSNKESQAVEERSMHKNVMDTKYCFPNQTSGSEIPAPIDAATGMIGDACSTDWTSAGSILLAVIQDTLNIEPSLAMDWLEISWVELHIKERVGAGSFGTVHPAEWQGSVCCKAAVLPPSCFFQAS